MLSDPKEDLQSKEDKLDKKPKDVELEKVTNDTKSVINKIKEKAMERLERERINYEIISISPYREKSDADRKKAFILNNTNTLILDKSNLIVFGEKIFKTKEFTFRLNLAEFLTFYWLEWKNVVYIYRDWEIIKAIRKNDIFVDENWDKVYIYFGDIISESKETLEKNLISVDKLQEKLWFIKIKWLYEGVDENWILIKAYLLDNSKIYALYNLETKDVKVLYANQESLERNILFYKKFVSTYKYFENVNMYDEPVNEEILPSWRKEQLDWFLRPQAIRALKKWNKNYFEFKGIKYPLFVNWKPNIPQVCIDFVLDFYEKFNDSYYDRYWNHPDKLNFEKIFGGFFKRRRVEYILDCIVNNKNNLQEYFKLIDLPDNLKVSYNMWEKIVDIIRNNLSKIVKPGDTIIIYGPLNDGLMHYHAFIVYQVSHNNDIIVMENTKYPSKESLIRVLSRSPKRKIIHIIRPTEKVLNF